MTTPDDPEVVRRLRGLDACALSDACDRLALDGQVVTGLANLTGRQPVAGRAVTVLLGAPTPHRTTRHLCTAAIEAAGPDDVIVVAHQGRSDCAGWGGNLSRAAQARGIAGTIVDGAARDIDEAADIGYPVYAAGSTPRTARRRTQEHDWNIAIDIAGVTVRPGDLVLADTTGIVVIPAGHAATIIALAESIAANEALMASAIDGGRPVSTVMGDSYEHMLDDRDEGSAADPRPS